MLLRRHAACARVGAGAAARAATPGRGTAHGRDGASVAASRSACPAFDYSDLMAAMQVVDTAIPKVRPELARADRIGAVDEDAAGCGSPRIVGGRPGRAPGGRAAGAVSGRDPGRPAAGLPFVAKLELTGAAEQHATQSPAFATLHLKAARRAISIPPTSSLAAAKAWALGRLGAWALGRLGECESRDTVAKGGLALPGHFEAG